MDNGPDPVSRLIALVVAILVYSCIYLSFRFWWNRRKCLKLVRDGVAVQGTLNNILTHCSYARNDGKRIFHEFEYKTRDIKSNEYYVRKSIEFNKDDVVQRRCPQPGNAIAIVVWGYSEPSWIWTTT